jgi:hypothetical protein
MDPLSLLCRLATSVPPPRFHTVRYAGVLASASPWRSRIAPKPPDAGPATEPETPKGAGGYRGWGELLARMFGVDVLACPRCQGRLKPMATVTDPASIARYLAAVARRRRCRAALPAVARRTGRVRSFAAGPQATRTAAATTVAGKTRRVRQGAKARSAAVQERSARATRNRTADCFRAAKKVTRQPTIGVGQRRPPRPQGPDNALLLRESGLINLRSVDSHSKGSDNIFKVFLSSTSQDLSDHRAAVADMILRLTQLPIQMETLGARPRLSVAECRSLVKQSDAVVVIVAYRYGWIPSVEDGGDSEKSITWLEVEAAIDAGKPVFGYVVDPRVPNPSSDSPDLPHLERFRAFLGKRVRETFSSPDDLAKKVSADLANWISNPWSDLPLFLQSLRIPDSDPEGPELLFADIDTHTLRLLDVARASGPQDHAGFDEALAGKRLGAATQQRDAFVARGLRKSQAMRQTIAKRESEAEQLAAAIHAIQMEQPPVAPIEPARPQLVSEIDRRDWDQRLSQHRRAVARHEQAERAYRERCASLPGLRDGANRLRHETEQAGRDVGAFEQRFAFETLELGHTIETARGEDIVEFLEDLRASSIRDLDDAPFAARGFFRLLALQELVPLMRTRGASSAASIFQIAEDAARRAEAAVRARPRFIAYDALRRCRIVDLALRRNAKELDGIRSVLDTVAGDEVVRAADDARKMNEEPRFPPVPPYEIDDPTELTNLSTTLSRARERIGAAVGARRDLLGNTDEIFRRSTAARADVGARRSRMEALATSYQPRVTELSEFWNVLTSACQTTEVTEAVKQFVSALDQELAGRCGKTAGALVAVCRSTHFLVADAERVIAAHPSMQLIENRDALSKAVGAMTILESKYEHALADIPNVPERRARMYRIRMLRYAIGAVVPIGNVIAAVLLLLDVSRLRPAFRSQLRCYVDLRIFAVRVILGVATVSLLIVALRLSMSARYPVTLRLATGEPDWTTAAIATYVVTLLLALSSLIRIRT